MEDERNDLVMAMHEDAGDDSAAAVGHRDGRRPSAEAAVAHTGDLVVRRECDARLRKTLVGRREVEVAERIEKVRLAPGDPEDTAQDAEMMKVRHDDAVQPDAESGADVELHVRDLEVRQQARYRRVLGDV